jgi:hypothetical protein
MHCGQLPGSRKPKPARRVGCGMAAGNVMQGSRGGVDLPQSDIDRVKSHLAKYYKKMGEEAPWQRD